MSLFDGFYQFEHVAVPEWLIDAAFCEINKAYIETPELNDWANAHLLPMIHQVTGLTTLEMCANHIHIGAEGLTPHDHLPNAFTSVLFLCDAEGELAIHLPDGKMHLIKPKEGLMVFFPAEIIHHVNRSPNDELRVSFVSNYEYSAPV